MTFNDVAILSANEAESAGNVATAHEAESAGDVATAHEAESADVVAAAHEAELVGNISKVVAWHQKHQVAVIENWQP